MTPPPELVNLSQALNEILVRGRAECERAVRAIRWGELPVWAVASPESLPSAEALEYAFGDLLGWPLIAREAAAFTAEGAAMVRPGSIVVVFADGTESARDAARVAHKRGAQVLAVSSEPLPPEPETPRATPGDPRLTLRLPASGAAAEGELGLACLQHAAAVQLALVCARQLTRPDARIERCENEWRGVPAQIDVLVRRVGDGVTALARELTSLNPILLPGGGYYTGIVRRASALARRKSGRVVIGFDLAALASGWLQVLKPGSAVLLTCGSGGLVAREIAALAGPIKERGCSLFALTGSNHHELIRQARLSLLLPETGDLPGSILALAVAGWVAGQLGKTSAESRSGSVKAEKTVL